MIVFRLKKGVRVTKGDASRRDAKNPRKSENCFTWIYRKISIAGIAPFGLSRTGIRVTVTLVTPMPGWGENRLTANQLKDCHV
ncbi:Uncharacterised protein [Mycobacteroides abscessus subsp. bolletii]|nr:Uncharacterised protein [Mycobacteroides abscessus subsp. bolletii]